MKAKVLKGIKFNKSSFKPLLALYEIYDELSQSRVGLACGKGCSVCCTDRVAVTTLEARYVLKGVNKNKIPLVQPELIGPKCTFNALARHCLNKIEPPLEEDIFESVSSCVFLQDGLCSIYDYRPLACRTMASQEKCQKNGSALEDSWWITVNTVFFQIVEHLDQRGGFGLLNEVLWVLMQGDERKLLTCEQIPGFPASPQHAEGLNRLLPRIMGKYVSGKPFGEWLSNASSRIV